MKKVLVAMSGGVDSSFSAFLLTKQGFSCTGVTMALNKDSEVNVEFARQAIQVCGQNHIVLDFSEEFKQTVILNFVEAYEQGLTPNPCIWCNQQFKFGKLLDYALENGFDYLATGHYVQVEYSNKLGRYILRKAVDITKDQTYFLYFLKQEQLAHILFPLGGLKKEYVKVMAKSAALKSASRSESQDICFVSGSYIDFIKKFRNNKIYSCGNFVDEAGRVLGHHEGIINYTFGQRKGLRVALGTPVYVKYIDVEKNEVVLAPKQNLLTKKIVLKDVNFMVDMDLKQKLQVSVKLRYTAVEHKAIISLIDSSRAQVELESLQIAPARGQAVVFYDDDIVVGGGTVI